MTTSEGTVTAYFKHMPGRNGEKKLVNPKKTGLWN